jgi:hypothetical protein
LLSVLWFRAMPPDCWARLFYPEGRSRTAFWAFYSDPFWYVAARWRVFCRVFCPSAAVALTWNTYRRSPYVLYILPTCHTHCAIVFSQRTDGRARCGHGRRAGHLRRLAWCRDAPRRLARRCCAWRRFCRACCAALSTTFRLTACYSFLGWITQAYS